jgi:hypothetical protein
MEQPMSMSRLKIVCAAVVLLVPVALATLARTSGSAAPAAPPAPPARQCSFGPGVFPNTKDSIPPGWTGPVFELSQDYPRTPPVAESLPWATIDFRADPKAYAMAVRDYIFEGNVNPSDFNAPWVVQNNPVRKWYHAPWMHAGPNGREFIHGLTRELASVPGQLWKNPPQNGNVQNWAVGFYNAPGGYAFGQAWCDPGKPNVTSVVNFPEGTVSGKLLFSGAPNSQVPFLANSVTWTANINTVVTDPNSPRSPQTVRLLQIDMAVRDSRATETGWVFGTLIYDPAVKSANPWEHMQPVGLSWGNDPGVTPTNGKPIRESWLNPDPTVKRPNLVQHYGWADRLNGPVDNPQSSCMSCHATAGWPPVSLIPADKMTDRQKLFWFRNVEAGVAFCQGQTVGTFKCPQQVSQDYSLQLTFGINNFVKFGPGAHLLRVAGRAASTSDTSPTPVITRAGDPEPEFRREAPKYLRQEKGKPVRRRHRR